MKIVLTEIFGNLHQFGFDKVYCVNQHGDALHVKTIIDAIKIANETFHMNIKLLMEPFDLSQQGLSGNEEYIMVDKAEYSPELFAEDDINEKDLLDIHAGALETATMLNFYPDAVCTESARQLKSFSLTESSLGVWLAGGEDVKSIVPQGYAGNPAGYEKKVSTAKVVFENLADYCARKIIEESLAK